MLPEVALLGVEAHRLVQRGVEIHAHPRDVGQEEVAHVDDDVVRRCSVLMAKFSRIDSENVRSIAFSNCSLSPARKFRVMRLIWM